MTAAAGSNQELAGRAERVMPGGHLSPSRRLGIDVAFTRAEGPFLYDVDGNRYVDFHCGFGANVLGHSHPAIHARVVEAIARLDLIGAGITDLEVETCEALARHIPCAEQVALCSTGSEATYHAIRLARAATGRTEVIKFQGCFHGWHDYVAMNVQSAAQAVGRYDPLSDGILEDAARHTVVLPYNDTEAVADHLAKHPDSVAAIILEPIAHNIGSIIASDAFLAGLRELCTRYGVVLIFDEVITGFRHSLAGYQAIAGVTPDLATFGKAAAGGYAAGILAGRRDLLQLVARTDDKAVFMGGTFNGTPAALAAILATIEELSKQGIYEYLFELGDHMRTGLNAIARDLGIPMQAAGFGSVWLPYFFEGPYERYDDLLRNDSAADLAFRQALVKSGYIFQPLPMKRLYLSMQHTTEIIDESLEHMRAILEKVFAPI